MGLKKVHTKVDAVIAVLEDMYGYNMLDGIMEFFQNKTIVGYAIHLSGCLIGEYGEEEVHEFSDFNPHVWVCEDMGVGGIVVFFGSSHFPDAKWQCFGEHQYVEAAQCAWEHLIAPLKKEDS